jgi:hypothetical protein
MSNVGQRGKSLVGQEESKFRQANSFRFENFEEINIALAD